MGWLTEPSQAGLSGIVLSCPAFLSCRHCDISAGGRACADKQTRRPTQRERTKADGTSQAEDKLKIYSLIDCDSGQERKKINKERDKGWQSLETSVQLYFTCLQLHR